MAATTQAALPFSGAGSQLTGDCLQCNALRSLLSQCGSCGGTTTGGGQTGGCPTSDLPAGPNGCPAGYSPDPAHPGCCASNSVTTTGQGGGCPTGDVSPGSTGACPPNYSPDPAHVGCCAPSNLITGQTGGCPTGDVAPGPTGACPTGYAPDANHPGCCAPTSGQGTTQTAPQAVEACFVCPGGLTELSAALAGQPNGCYLASQMFFPAGSQLPPPGQ